MKSIWNVTVACAVVAAFGAFGCERRDYDMNDENDRIERRADRTEDDVQNTAEDTGDRIEQAGRDARAEFRDGITYEVAKVDKDARTIELRKANLLPTVAEKKDLQKGEMLTLTFDDLAKHVEGDKSADEIAEELHVGENVSVFMGADKKITKITY